MSIMDKKKAQRVERARRLLSGVGVARDDSDDELGFEDNPWEWIRSTNDQSPSVIVGARMSAFQCFLGEAVLLKAEGLAKEAWVGLICSFIEDDETGEKAANFMWFSSEREIRNKKKKRQDFYANELYITPSWDINPLASINGKAQIFSPDAFFASFPTGRVPSKSQYWGKTFICRRGCNTRTATYTEEFVWEDIYSGQIADIDALIARIQNDTRATRKKKREFSHDGPTSDTKAGEALPVADPQTPRKRLNFEAASTPPSKSIPSAHTQIAIRKPLEYTPLGTRTLSLSDATSSHFHLARIRLHVSAVPTALPCREQEFAAIYSHLESAIASGSGSCIYISGTPGTGKTATVREVIAKLNASVQADDLDDFMFVEINGLKLTDPHQSYSLLWEALRGDRVSPSHALGLLNREFCHPSPRRVPCVVLMDELDQLVTKNQGVMYNFFNWPGFRHSKLIILAVANTMDLPERTLSNKISSRLGLTRITFPGYTYTQLRKIIESRLAGVAGDMVQPDAIQFASRKVAAVSGDARRALDICRRAVEIAEQEGTTTEPEQVTPSKRGRGKPTFLVRTERPLGMVTINTVKLAIAEATSTPIQKYLKSLPLSSKLFLLAFLARIRRSGVSESILREILDEVKQLVTMADGGPGLGYSDAQNILLDAGPVVLKPSRKFLAASVLAMGASALALREAGIISLEARKGELTAKIRLNVSDTDIQLALQGDAEVDGLRF